MERAEEEVLAGCAQIQSRRRKKPETDKPETDKPVLVAPPSSTFNSSHLASQLQG